MYLGLHSNLSKYFFKALISSFQLFGLWPFYLFPYWTDDRSKVFEQKIVWQVYFPNFFKLHFWANREFSLPSTSIWKNPPTHVIAMCQINLIFVGARISPASQRHTAQKIRIIEIRNKYYLPSTPISCEFLQQPCSRFFPHPRWLRHIFWQKRANDLAYSKRSELRTAGQGTFIL